MPVFVDAPADGAVGAFNGFVRAPGGDENIGTVQVTTTDAGKLGAISVNGSGYADVTGLADGVINADFVPIVSMKAGKATVKRAISLRANLWFDRLNEHAEGAGTGLVLNETL